MASLIKNSLYYFIPKAYSWQQVPTVLNPDQIARLLSSLRHGVFLDSGADTRRGCYDILSGQPLDTRQLSKKTVPDAHSKTFGDFGKHHQTIPSEYRSLPFVCGQIAYCSYEYGAQALIDHPYSFTHSRLPLAFCGYYCWSYVYHRQSGTGFITFSADCPLETRQLVLALIREENNKDTKPHDDRRYQLNWRKCISYHCYLERLKQAQAYIDAGDCYQVNLTQRLEADFFGTPLALYFKLRQSLNTPYSVYMSFAPDANLLCFSPEQFIGIQQKHIQARPIKGTIANNDDQSNATKLINSTKNQAENLMIVDLLRNDLSKVCQLNSVKVSALFELESYQNVHHLVSTIEGKLKPGISELDAFFACFPGGSITGAPKKRAMEIINELETSGRDAYCGSVFYLNDDGHFDSNILIRSIVHSGSQLFCWGGGGIVHDSIAEEEYLESLIKVANLTGVIE